MTPGKPDAAQDARDKHWRPPPPGSLTRLLAIGAVAAAALLLVFNSVIPRPPPDTAKTVRPVPPAPPPAPRVPAPGFVAPSAATAAPAQTNAAMSSQAANDPFLKPGTIYRCKSYSGEVFWSQAHCSRHRALIDRIASVPVGMPFQQQIEIASGEARAIEQIVRNEQARGAWYAECAALQNEREQIRKRSGSGAGTVPLDQLGRDQTRWRQIENLLNEKRCPR